MCSQLLQPCPVNSSAQGFVPAVSRGTIEKELPSLPAPPFRFVLEGLSTVFTTLCCFGTGLSSDLRRSVRPHFKYTCLFWRRELESPMIACLACESAVCGNVALTREECL
ncbi:hypothetical protein CDAR_36681 [Caerostris darwini]|uniref:Uncharacterized protein n=1 Tax=Caerostris darwini TaxID=1538125 RepID=A0AAV4UVI6_9ARAC|nr:hypothetical protein CDAR_36681 [Caerostris darwini]